MTLPLAPAAAPRRGALNSPAAPRRDCLKTTAVARRRFLKTPAVAAIGGLAAPSILRAATSELVIGCAGSHSSWMEASVAPT